MTDDNVIIAGAAKFRDGRKWKPRWCVLRRLSPAADCVQLEVWRESSGAAGGAAGGGLKAALSLQALVCAEAGFTLDKHSHTLALLCRDHTALLAFDSRDRLLLWQVKVAGAAGWAARHGVRLAGGAPARLHAARGRLALVAECPPRLLHVWDLSQVRRFGVAHGRFVLEAGARCGRDAGVHVLLPDAAAALELDVRRAAEHPPHAPRPAAPRLPAARSAHAGLSAAAAPPGLARCRSCTSALGFAPAWSMEPRRADSLETLTSLEDADCRLGPYDNYDVPRTPSIETCLVSTAGKTDRYYDTPRRLRACLARAGCGCAAPLYATVDVARKRRGRGADYENVPAAAAEYVPMAPAPPYANMSPRCASQPALAGLGARAARRRSSSAESAGGGGAGGESGGGGAGGVGERLSCSSTDSGVCEPQQRRVRGAGGGDSTSSGTDVSDYIETLSLCSSHSSTEAPDVLRVAAVAAAAARQTQRPRSGQEYGAPPAHPAHPAAPPRAATRLAH